MPPKKQKPKRVVEFHFIGELHPANPELPREERTFGRIDKEIEKAKKNGQRVVVTLELPHDYVEKLKILRDIKGEVTKEHIKQVFGGYIPVEDDIALMRKHKDVEFIGIDHDVVSKLTPETTREIINLASKHEFIKKALSDEVRSKLTTEEKRFLFSTLTEMIGRNEYMKNKIKELINSGKYDKIIHLSGSAHSTFAVNLRKEINKENPEIDLKLKIQHTLDKAHPRLLEKVVGKEGRRILFLYYPHDTLVRMIDIGKLDHLSKNEIVKLIKETSRFSREHLLESVRVARKTEEITGTKLPAIIRYTLSNLRFDLEKRAYTLKNIPSKQMVDIVKKIMKNEKEKSKKG